MGSIVVSHWTWLEVFREFGISPEDGIEMIARLKEFYERTTLEHLRSAGQVQMILNGAVIRDTEEIIDTFATLKEKGYGDTVLIGDQDVGKSGDLTPETGASIWEKHGWNFVHEFIQDIPALEKGYEYCFYFRLTDEKHPKDGLEFPMFMIAVMYPKLGADANDISLGCNIERSSDGQNYFALLRRKEI